MTIKCFEDPDLGSAEQELESLGTDEVVLCLNHLGNVYRHPPDPDENYSTYKEIPFYVYKPRKSIMIFAIEKDAQENQTITVMFAGQRGYRRPVAGYVWDGVNLEALFANVILSRARKFFL